PHKLWCHTALVPCALPWQEPPEWFLVQLHSRGGAQWAASSALVSERRAGDRRKASGTAACDARSLARRSSWGRGRNADAPRSIPGGAASWMSVPCWPLLVEQLIVCFGQTDGPISGPLVPFRPLVVLTTLPCRRLFVQGV